MPAFSILHNLPFLKKSCFCNSLKKGSYIIGSITILFALLGILQLLTSTSYRPSFQTFTEVGVYIVKIYVAILLIIGINKNDKQYLKVWIAAQTLWIILSIYDEIQEFNSINIRHEEILVVIQIVGLVLEIYFFLIVYSFYRELDGRVNDHEITPSQETA